MDTGASAIDEAGRREDSPDPAIVDFVVRSGLVPHGAAAGFDCKRALPQVRVSADWRAPIERNTKEAGWIKAVAGFMPEAVPALLAEDGEAGMFAMDYLPPQSFEGWKVQLQRGHVMPATATEIGRCLARIHSRFARSPTTAAEFATDGIFHAIRLEPYLLATARAHPDRAAVREKLAETTARTKLPLVHGDVSPKNILVGPQGPVFIDAECAWFGDPAFDLAFCLNHLLLKCLWVPWAAGRLLAAFQSLTETYLGGVDWEPNQDIDRRAARLLPGLFLARIDGKSPVEYLTEERDKHTVRRIARSLLACPPDCLAEIRKVWASEIHPVS